MGCFPLSANTFLSARTWCGRTTWQPSVASSAKFRSCSPRGIRCARWWRRLGIEGERLAANLEDPPLWSTISRCAWRSTWEGRAGSGPGVASTRIQSGVRNVRARRRELREPGVAPALHREVLRQYRLWLGISDSPSRERAYLETLSRVSDGDVGQVPATFCRISAAATSLLAFCGRRTGCRRLADAEPGACRAGRSAFGADLPDLGGGRGLGSLGHRDDAGRETGVTARQPPGIDSRRNGADNVEICFLGAGGQFASTPTVNWCGWCRATRRRTWSPGCSMSSRTWSRS